MPRSPGLLRIVRNKFFAGLLILVPIVITGHALWWLFSFVENISKPLSDRLLGRELPGLGFATTVAIVFVTGLLFSAGPLRRLLDGLEEVIEYVPIAGVVYVTIKKVFSGVADLRSRGAFKRFVLARLRGRTSPGFLTSTFELKRSDGTSETVCTVYLPTNHLYVGDIVVLPVADVIETDLSIEDGISMILSAGASAPVSVGESAMRVEPRRD